MIETQGELFIDVQKSGHLVKYSSPPFRLLASIILLDNAEDGSQPLIVKFLLDYKRQKSD